jgi:hypothetical protein
MTNEKINDGKGFAQPGDSGAAVAMLGSIFLERFVFYAARMLLFAFLMNAMGTSGAAAIYFNHHTSLFLAPVVLGLLLDFLVDFRLGIAMGAGLTGMGLLLLGLGNETTIFMGLAMLAVGSSAARISSLSLLGYVLPQQAGKIEGGFTISWALVQFGALISAGLTTWVADGVGNEAMFIFLGILAGLHAFIILILNGNGVLPSRSSIAGEQQMEPRGQLAGLFLIVGLVLSGYLYLTWVAGADIGTIGYMVINAAAFLMLAIAFVVQVQVPTRFAGRRSGAIGLLILVSVFFWQVYELCDTFTLRSGFRMPSLGSLNLDTMLALVATLIVGLVVFFRHQPDFRGYGSATLRILVGAGLGILGNLALLMPGNENLIYVIVALSLGAVAEALFSPTLYALVWRLSPGRRKANGLGMLITSAGFSNLLGRLFMRDGAADGELDFPVILFGIALSLVLLIGALVGVALLLRNLASKERQAENPFG